MENPMNWFFIAARNEYLDRFRKARRTRQYQQYLEEVFTDSLASPAAYVSPETILSNKLYTELYYEAIRNLPEKQQLAYSLSRENGLTYEQIAEEMKIEKSTVKEHIARAMRSIRNFLTSKAGPGGELLFFLIFLKLLSPSFIYVSSLL
jgi:RNA polymerase sigma factor (sigma-70 family)